MGREGGICVIGFRGMDATDAVIALHSKLMDYVLFANRRCDTLHLLFSSCIDIIIKLSSSLAAAAAAAA